MSRTGVYLLTIALLLATACTAHAASKLDVTITNPGFEDGVTGWGWSTMGGCQSSYRSETANPHSGRKCLVLVNESGFGPNVYGRLVQAARVQPDTVYEFSVWVRGEGVEAAQGPSHFTDWMTYTVNLPSGTFGWTRVTGRVRTRPDQFFLNLGLNVVNSCKALAIDDVTLRAVGDEFKGQGVEGSVVAPRRVVGDDAPGYLAAIVRSTLSDASVEAIISSDRAVILSKRAGLRRGETEIDWKWNSRKAPFGDYACVVRVVDSAGKSLAETRWAMAKVKSPISDDIDRVDARLPEFESLYKQCQAKGIALDYPTAARTMLKECIPLARQDLRAGHDWRAQFAVTDFNRSIDEAISQMKAYLADPSLSPNVPRYQTGKVSVDGLSFVGNSKDNQGAVRRGPLFFCGFGHFKRVRDDIPLWPGYGVNIIQFSEFGPSTVFPSEGKVSLDYVRTLRKTLDDAAKHNVRVDFLLSPHYFPQWAMDKWPHLAKGNGGFISYNVDAPEAKTLVEKFLRLVIPMVKDKPALHSFCLTNEPVMINFADCDNTRPMWLDYLARAHGTIDALNRHYGTSFSSFADVPLQAKGPELYDYCIFAQERFSAWHKWMADICHELAPDIPVHAKAMSTELNPGTVGWGVDHELLGQLLDLNGNDCFMSPAGGPGYSVDWALQGSSYDMQRSWARKPIFNSENHLTGDFSRSYVAPEHFRTALWQGAVHGQGATTIWVWDRTDDPAECLYGNVGDRPGCGQAVGTTCMDLNRFADEVTALQNAKSPVALLYSASSMIRNGGAHSGAIWRLYTALNFCGVKVDFISEKQLAAGKGSQYRMIILPQASHVTDAAFQGLRDLTSTTRVVFVNECLTGDPYGKPRPAALVAELRARSTILTDGDSMTVLWPALRKHLGDLGALPEVSVVDAQTGEPVWGVEWLSANVSGRTVINMVNLTDQPKDIKIVRAGRDLSARDLLSLGGRRIVRRLRPITPVLAEVIR